MDNLKASRKQKIAKEIQHIEWYDSFGKYKKGKIHCSCALCAAKTNDRLFKSRGPVSEVRRTHSGRYATTTERFGKNYSGRDKRIIIRMDQDMEEYVRSAEG